MPAAKKYSPRRRGRQTAAETNIFLTTNQNLYGSMVQFCFFRKIFVGGIPAEASKGNYTSYFIIVGDANYFCHSAEKH